MTYHDRRETTTEYRVRVVIERRRVTRERDVLSDVPRKVHASRWVKSDLFDSTTDVGDDLPIALDMAQSAVLESRAEQARVHEARAETGRVRVRDERGDR